MREISQKKGFFFEIWSYFAIEKYIVDTDATLATVSLDLFIGLNFVKINKNKMNVCVLWRDGIKRDIQKKYCTRVSKRVRK